MLSQLVFLSHVAHAVVKYQGEGHDDNCVDNSHYSGIEYKVCQKKKEEVCIPVRKMTCDLVAYTDCSTRPIASTQR